MMVSEISAQYRPDPNRKRKKNEDFASLKTSKVLTIQKKKKKNREINVTTWFLTRVSSSVHCSTKQQQVLCEGGMEETHGAHPASSIHKHPLQVLIW